MKLKSFWGKLKFFLLFLRLNAYAHVASESVKTLLVYLCSYFVETSNKTKLLFFVFSGFSTPSTMKVRRFPFKYFIYFFYKNANILRGGKGSIYIFVFFPTHSSSFLLLIMPMAISETLLLKLFLNFIRYHLSENKNEKVLRQWRS